jgi:NAD+ diphosphatase
MRDPVTFAGGRLDRAAERRSDAAWLAQCLASDDSRFLALWRLRPLVKPGEPLGLAWARRDLLAACPGSQSAPILLGVSGGIAHFAFDVSALEKPESELGVRGVAEFHEARGAAARLARDDAANVAVARSLAAWHETQRFCGACGAKTRPERAGWMRRCDSCDREHFPRTDPVVIAVVVRGDRCLLGRQPSWPERMFSALAGFVEPGESLEEAVRREVREEAGVEVGAVRYHATQPWPFPHSLMIGCVADGLSDEISLNDRELGAARWFTRDELRAALAGGGDYSVPGPLAIAHHLIRAFVVG